MLKQHFPIILDIRYFIWITNFFLQTITHLISHKFFMHIIIKITRISRYNINIIVVVNYQILSVILEFF